MRTEINLILAASPAHHLNKTSKLTVMLLNIHHSTHPL